MKRLEIALKKDIVAVCRALYQRQLLAATDGNLSMRWGDHLLTTPSGVNKGFIKEDEIVTVDLQGQHVSGPGQATSELLLHLEVYHRRPDVRAVIHAHPPIATAFTIAGLSLAEGILPEVVLSLGAIPTAPYATTGTPAMAAAIRELLPYYDAILLEQHGALTAGASLWEAYNRMEKVEHAAWTVFLARQLGQARPLPPQEVARLTAMGIRRGYRPPLAAELLEPGEPSQETLDFGRVK